MNIVFHFLYFIKGLILYFIKGLLLFLYFVQQRLIATFKAKVPWARKAIASIASMSPRLPSHILLLLAGNPSLHHCLQHHHRHPNIMTMSVFWLLVSCISLLNTSTKYYFKGWSKLKVLAKGIFSAILTAWSLIQEEPTGFGSKEIQNWYLKVTGGEN